MDVGQGQVIQIHEWCWNSIKKSPRDYKVRDTILAIVEEFFEKNVAALLYICETGDGKQMARGRLFAYWFQSSGQSKVFTTMTSVLMDEEGVENTATLILRNDNPDFDILVSEYSQTVRFLSQKPNEHGWLSITHLPPCASAALSAHKHSHYVRQTIAALLRKTPRATPQGANFRASESKASSSLECSAERSRDSTKLTFYCVKQSPSAAAAPSAHKHSQFYFVKLHEQPFRACACLRVQNSGFTG